VEVGIGEERPNKSECNKACFVLGTFSKHINKMPIYFNCAIHKNYAVYCTHYQYIRVVELNERMIGIYN
jgi:hypothetical protein